MMLNLKHALFMAMLLAANILHAADEWGNSVNDVQLSISITYNFVLSGSEVWLECLSTNWSTNNICFIKTDPKAMYSVAAISSKGESFVLASPAYLKETQETMGRISQNEGFECKVPLKFDKKMEAGKYTIVAKQEILIYTNFYQMPRRGAAERKELISNSIEVQVK